MPEAVRAVIQYLFEAGDLDFILAGRFPHNARSARVIEKCGFKTIKIVPYETAFGTMEQSVGSILYNTRIKQS